MDAFNSRRDELKVKVTTRRTRAEGVTVTNNDVFRNMLHLTGVGRDKDLVIELFRLGGVHATNSKIKGWRTTADNPRSFPMTDETLKAFFAGFFAYRDNMLANGVIIFNFKNNQAPLASHRQAN